MGKWAGLLTLLPTNMAAVIKTYGDFLNFEELQLLHYLVYRPETCRDLSEQGYLNCVKILSKNLSLKFLMTPLQTKNSHSEGYGAKHFQVSEREGPKTSRKFWPPQQ